MYHELYIDVFFLENLMMDSLLLLALNHILKCGRALGRLFLCGALGSLLTCVTVVIPFPGLVKMILFHVVINSLMILGGLKIRSASQFVKAFFLLYAVSAFLGGVMLIFRPYMRFISLFYGIAFAAYLLFLKLWKFMAQVLRQQQEILRVTLYTEKGEKKAAALWDTGNKLRDFVTNDPVNILDPGFLHEITELPEAERGFHMIPYRCVSGERVMKVFRIKKMCVHMGGEEDRWIENPLLGIGEESLSGNREYMIILNPGIFSP